MYPDSSQCSMFTRSAAACQSGDGEVLQRQQLNTITSYIDGSVVYGSSNDIARQLRDLESMLISVVFVESKTVQSKRFRHDEYFF